MKSVEGSGSARRMLASAVGDKWTQKPGVKKFLLGTHRCVGPAETVARVTRLMPVLGITRVANVTGLDTIGIPVFMICRPNSRSISVSQGKGVDADSARASGLMESLEGYHAERITLPLKLASFNDLRFTHQTVQPGQLPRLSTVAFHPNLRLLWIEGVDLLTGTGYWLPYELVHCDFRVPFPCGSGCFPLSSNGLASGNHMLEAIIHGICEVVERHCSALWEDLPAPQKASTRIDPATISDPLCREILRRFESTGVAVGLWEMTSTLGIPAFVCHIASTQPGGDGLPETFGGMGCHPSREIAVLRALTEAAQGRLTFIAGSRDDLLRSRYGLESNRELLSLIHDPTAEARDLQQVPTHESGTLEEDLHWILLKLSQAGVQQVLSVDLTKEGIDIPVVKIVIPGLRPKKDFPCYLPAPLVDRVREVGE